MAEPPGRSPSLVIGASGFIGGALLGALLERGDPVRALAHSGGSAQQLQRSGAEVVRGDLLDEASLVAAMTGVDTVFHAAGVNAFCLPDPSVLYRVNVKGSAQVVRAAANAGVRRVVYTSSAATLGEEHATIGSETSPHRGWFLSDYERSKYQAEQEVLRVGTAQGVDVVCVNPSSVQGPGRTHGTAKLLLRYVNGKLRFVVDTTVSFLDINDCTAGHLLAAERGEPGQRYVLNGGRTSLGELLDVVAKVSGIRHPVHRLPPVLAKAAAAAIGTGFRLARRRAPICPEMIATLLHGHAYDGSRATRELGLRYTPLPATIARTLTWYADHGYITARPGGNHG